MAGTKRYNGGQSDGSARTFGGAVDAAAPETQAVKVGAAGMASRRAIAAACEGRKLLRGKPDRRFRFLVISSFAVAQASGWSLDASFDASCRC